MTCKWCGGSGHPEDDCPTRNLVKFLQDEPLDPGATLPDRVVAMGEDQLIDELTQRSKITKEDDRLEG